MAMVDDLVAQSCGQIALQLFDLFRAKLDHIACFEIHDMVVVTCCGRLEPCATTFKTVPFHQPRGFQHCKVPIDCCERNCSIDDLGPAMEFRGVWMIVRILQNRQNHDPLRCHTNTVRLQCHARAGFDKAGFLPCTRKRHFEGAFTQKCNCKLLSIA